MFQSKPFLLAIFLAASSALGITATAYAQDDSALSAQVQTAKININTADAQTLAMGLSGIGPSKAQAIVDYRAANGNFRTVDELLEVKGIGVATLQRIQGQLTVD